MTRPPGRGPGTGPDHGPPYWHRLYAESGPRHGFFTMEEARRCSISQPLVHYHTSTGWLERHGRGIYRVGFFPLLDPADARRMVWWLTFDRRGVFTHESAADLHALCEAPPAREVLTLPRAWTNRRLQQPPGLTLYFADVPAADQVALEGLPATRLARTLRDCAADELCDEAWLAAVRRCAAAGEYAR